MLVSEGQVADGEDAVALRVLGSVSARVPSTLDDEISEALADGPAPLDLGPLTPAELDAAVATELATPAVTDAMSMLYSSDAYDAITEVFPSASRGRGESIKRRKRSRKPGDQRRES